MSTVIFKDQILGGVLGKKDCRRTTSIQFKSDVVDFFQDEIWRERIAVELGTNRGYTTRVLSFMFGHVYTFDTDLNHLREAEEFNNDRTNISFFGKNVYAMNWKKNIPEPFDVIFSDCIHTEEFVRKDIDNALKYGTEEVYLIFDDYGNDKATVKQEVDRAINDKKIEFVSYIGQEPNSEIYENRFINNWEGIICKRY